MINHLYDIFSHWFKTDGVHKNAVWVYSDTHFNDPTMPHIRKNYIGDEEQIKRINSKVGKKDTIIILGDIGDVEWVKKIRGYKVLIMGNHESGESNYKRTMIPEDNHLFDEVYKGPLTISDRLILTHEPIDVASFLFNIHGHDHSNWYINQPNQHLNVCAEHINYTPLSLGGLIKDGLLKNIDSIHRVTIDRAAAKKKERTGKKV